MHRLCNAFVVVLAAPALLGVRADCDASRARGAEQAKATLLTSLPEPRAERYKVDPYLQAAADIQAKPANVAADTLRAMARHDDSNRTIVLCRILFTAKPGETFWRPAIGGAVFLGGTDYRDWPLEPIQLVDGVPFLISRGYILLGQTTSAESYVRYCLEHCDWNPIRYKPKSAAEKDAALAELLASPKWKTKLPAYDREFLSAQIR
jgi:hypothetical protein